MRGSKFELFLFKEVIEDNVSTTVGRLNEKRSALFIIPNHFEFNGGFMVF